MQVAKHGNMDISGPAKTMYVLLIIKKNKYNGP